MNQQTIGVQLTTFDIENLLAALNTVTIRGDGALPLVILQSKLNSSLNALKNQIETQPSGENTETQQLEIAQETQVTDTEPQPE